MSSQTSRNGLPVPPEILVSILDFLSLPDFIALTSASKELHSVYYEPTFWKVRTQVDFRLPPQPFFEQDGKRWQWLYKSLRTRSTVYTWGSGNHGNLGRPSAINLLQKAWPGVMDNLERVGVVADVQCGGWSTVLLNTKGDLYATGVVNGDRTRYNSQLQDATSVKSVTMPFSTDGQRPLDLYHRAIKQFSMGRTRLLAMTDEDEIIEWSEHFAAPGEVLTVDMQQIGKEHTKDPRATQIVAGWAHGSAYFPTEGLHYWTSTGPKQGELANRILSFGGDVRRIPGTKSVAYPVEGSIEDRMGPVKKYLVLEHHVIMLTEGGRLFSWKMPNIDSNSQEEMEDWEPTELTPLCLEHTQSDLLDIQGSFRRFAVFHKDGSVQLCLLDDDAELPNTYRGRVDIGASSSVQLQMPPVLQDGSIIQLAFGDHHYHALHRDGSVTSHGTDPMCTGALGLGPGHLSFLRGVDWQPMGDGNILFHPDSDGKRTIWFEPEKFIYLSTMLDKFMKELRHDGLIRQIASRAYRIFRETYGEFFELEGRNWSSGPERPVSGSRTGDGSIEPYYVLKVTAAGWAGAAVVLVDEVRAKEVREKYLLPEFQPTESKATWRQWITDLWVRAQSMSLGIFNDDQEPSQYSDDAKCYVWSEQAFPILRMPGYQIEEEKLSSWKDGEPSWLLRSTE